MSKDTCVQEIKSACESKTLQEATETGKAPIFEVCLPFGGRLYSQGGYVNYEAGTPPADGVYTTVTIRNGCIVSVGQADISTYTSAPCAPVPDSCGGSSNGSDSGSSTKTTRSAMSTQVKTAEIMSSEVSLLSGNLSSIDSAGSIYTAVYVRGGDGISVTGTGTAFDPLIITANEAEAQMTIVHAGNAGISVTGEGTSSSPYMISHIEQAGAVNVNGMTFDRFGHLTGYTAPTSSLTINGVLAGDGIAVDLNNTNGVATVSLSQPLHELEGEYQLGGFEVSVDNKNRFYNINRLINFPGGVYRLGRWDVMINQYGSVESASQLPVNIATNSVSHYYEGAETNPSLTFTIDQPASFRIDIESFTAFAVTTMQVLIDGVPVTANRIGTNKLIGLSDAIWAAGTHTVTLSGAIPVKTYVMVHMTTVI